MNRGRVLRWTLVAILALAGCGADDVPPPGQPAPATSTDVNASAKRRQPCNEKIPFGFTYLPQGFDRELIEGPAPGGRRRESKMQVIFHVRGSGGRAIEVRRPGTLFVELAQASDAPTIRVLGEDTTGFAPTSPGGDEFIVQFGYPPGARPHDFCANFSLNEVGVPLSELKKVAQGLRE